jgi:archaellin
MWNLFGRLLRFDRDQRGLIGAETAGVLASVVVAGSILSAIVLDTGVFGAERTRDAVLQGIDRVRGAVELRGMVVATASGHTPTAVRFNLTPAAGGRAIPLPPPGATSALVINFSTSTARVTAVPYTVIWLASDSSDDLLGPGEIAEIVVALPLGDEAPCPCTLRPNEPFTIEILVPNGATLTFERRLPPALTPVMALY